MKDINIRTSTSLYPYRDTNGFRKMIIALTQPGEILDLGHFLAIHGGCCLLSPLLSFPHLSPHGETEACRCNISSHVRLTLFTGQQHPFCNRSSFIWSMPGFSHCHADLLRVIQLGTQSQAQRLSIPCRKALWAAFWARRSDLAGQSWQRKEFQQSIGMANSPGCGRCASGGGCGMLQRHHPCHLC